MKQMIQTFFGRWEADFKEIKRLKSPQKAEVYLEPKQASTMEDFCEYT